MSTINDDILNSDFSLNSVETESYSATKIEKKQSRREVLESILEETNNLKASYKVILENIESTLYQKIIRLGAKSINVSNESRDATFECDNYSFSYGNGILRVFPNFIIDESNISNYKKAIKNVSLQRGIILEFMDDERAGYLFLGIPVSSGPDLNSIDSLVFTMRLVEEQIDLM